MAPAGNKVKCLSSVNHTTKTIHHHSQSTTHERKAPWRSSSEFFLKNAVKTVF